MWTVLPIIMLEQVVMVAWAIWEARNGRVWQQRVSEPGTIVRLALLYEENWKANREEGDNIHTPVADFQIEYSALQNSGDVRINIDIAMDYAAHRMGFGWSVTDGDDTEAEAMGAREALSWIKGKGWPRVVLETDAKLVTQALTGGANISPFGSIIEDVRELLDQLPMVTFRHVHRSKNMLAHSLAKRALTCLGDDRIEMFDFIPRSVGKHLCNSS
ncbi:PREDICTED: uncharacterized protein LOC109179176 [Ipomoea nil]|uniref:uncharacterized protein LOC109179176 n=1 Tax=Ipomoea nil TaxID=35883 RepID=UPI00090161DD|nr:PREDICTED: uncharacterized protein LOC109179176 [Ipomoea nil]